jgi:hypothetical protein
LGSFRAPFLSLAVENVDASEKHGLDHPPSFSRGQRVTSGYGS